MKALTITHKVFIAALLVFVGSVGLYWHVYRHQGIDRTNLLEARDARDDAYTLSKSLDAMRELAKGTVAQRATLDSYRLSIKDPTTFLSLVENMAADAGVSLLVQTLSLEEPNEKNNEDFAKRVRVVLEVSGSWDGVYHTLSLLEHLPYATVIDRVAFSQEETDGVRVWSGHVHMWVLAST